MKSLRFLALLLLIGGAADAQEPAATPARPSPPYVNRAPAYSAWVMNCKPLPTPKPAQGSASPAPAPSPVVQQLTVVKAGDTIREERVDAAGRKIERWIVGNLQAVHPTDSSQIVVTNGTGESDLYDANYVQSDFSGFEWLSDKTYTETKQVGATNCYVFRGVVSDLTPAEANAMEAYYRDVKMLWEKYHAEAEKAGSKMQDPNDPTLRAANHHLPAVACIDVATKLPVLLQTGSEVRSYQFNPTPPGPLTLPPDIQQAITQRQQRVRAAAATPAAP